MPATERALSKTNTVTYILKSDNLYHELFKVLRLPGAGQNEHTRHIDETTNCLSMLYSSTWPGLFQPSALIRTRLVIKTSRKHLCSRHDANKSRDSKGLQTSAHPCQIKDSQESEVPAKWLSSLTEPKAIPRTKIAWRTQQSSHYNFKTQECNQAASFSMKNKSWKAIKPHSKFGNAGFKAYPQIFHSWTTSGSTDGNL